MQVNYQKNMKIDAVFTWVDGSDPDFKKKFSTTLKNFKQKEILIKNGLSPARFKNHNELKYALRSIHIYMPWIRKIFIVMTDRQAPSFIKQTDKIKFVYQSEIFPKWAKIPSFSSNIIETFISRIQELSEYYIYFNDDFLIGKKLDPTYFFTSDGKPILPVKVDSEFNSDNLKKEKVINKKLISDKNYIKEFLKKLDALFKNQSWKAFFNTKYLIKSLYGKSSQLLKINLIHTPKPFRKSKQEELNEYFKHYIDILSQYQFRTTRDIWFDFLKSIEGIRRDYYTFRPLTNKDILEMNFKNKKSYKDLLKIFKTNYSFISISQGTSSIEELIKDTINLLEARYPITSPWEITSDDCTKKMKKIQKVLQKISNLLPL